MPRGFAFGQKDVFAKSLGVVEDILRVRIVEFNELKRTLTME